MSKRVASVLSGLTALLGAAAAFAQPSAMSAASEPAPQTDAWREVSHINGQVVPVGERGNYLYKQRKTNISTNPIGWMVGFYGLSVSHVVHPNVAIRGDANYISIDGSRGYEVGISAPIYFKRAYQGPFIEPGLIARGELDDDDYENSYCDYDCDDSDSMMGPEMLFGWHWTFDSGLNVAAAIGVARDLDEDDAYDSGVQPAGYFRVGYAF